MKMIKVEDAIGSILTHDVTQIIPGQFKGRIFKKGHLIQEEDIEKLRAIGKEHIYVWEVKEGQLHENDAAIRLSNLAKGDGIRASDEIKEGKIDFFADCDGVLKIDKEKLMTLNSIGEMMMATIQTNTPLKKGEKIGGTRVIPLVIDEEKIKEAETLITDKIMWMEPFKAKKCLLITTGNEVYKGTIKDAFLPVIKKKLEYYGSTVSRQVILPDQKELIIEAIQQGLQENVDLIICTGGMSVDPDDVTPSAIKESGGRLVTYGSPVLPGAMFLLAYHGKTPVLGVPSCAMYSKRTVLDLVLPRILIDEELTAEDIAAYGHGGLCLDCGVCTFPHCSFGK